MATKRKPYLHQPVTYQDLADAVTWARWLMDWKRDPQLAAGAAARGLPAGATESLEHAAAMAARMVPKRKARAVFLAAMAGRVQAEDVRSVYHEAVKAIHLCVPLAAEVVMSKMDDARAPGSLKAALEILKGCGVLVPAEPMKSKDRMTDMEENELRKRDPEVVKAEILGFS